MMPLPRVRLIDAFVADWLTPLEAAAAPSGAAIQLLLDGVCVPGMYRAAQHALGSRDAVQLLFEHLPGCNDETREVSPFVLPCSSMTPVLRRLLQCCDGMPMVQAVWTDETTAQLACRLAKWCVVELEGQRYNLRFSDTRRVAGIYAALTPWQQRSFYGHASRWCYVGRDGQWTELPQPPDAEQDSAAPQIPSLAHSAVPLSTAQFAQMLDDGDADSMLLMLRERGALTLGRSHSILYEATRLALDAARASALDASLTLPWCRACLEDHDLLARVLHDPAALRQWQQERSFGATQPSSSEFT